MTAGKPKQNSYTSVTALTRFQRSMISQHHTDGRVTPSTLGSSQIRLIKQSRMKALTLRLIDSRVDKV